MSGEPVQRASMSGVHDGAAPHPNGDWLLVDKVKGGGGQRWVWCLVTDGSYYEFDQIPARCARRVRMF